MNQNIEVALKQAFSLIEAGNLEDAKALLRPILESEKDNADVWWLYSHAVTDSETARLALNNVLRMDLNYPDARELLGQLEARQKTDQFDDILDMDKDPIFIPAMPSSVPGITPLSPRGDFSGSKVSDSLEDLPDEMFDDEEPESFYRRPVFYVPLISLLLIAALAIVIVKPFAVNPPAMQAPLQTAQAISLETPTSEAVSSGESTPISIPTIQIDTTGIAEVVSDFSSISSAFTAYKLANDGSIEIVDTNLGKTLAVNICTSAGKEMRELLPKAMDTLATAISSYTSQAQVVAVRMLDCNANSTLLWIGASIEDATAFAGGAITDKEFQAKWKPIK